MKLRSIFKRALKCIVSICKKFVELCANNTIKFSVENGEFSCSVDLNGLLVA